MVAPPHLLFSSRSVLESAAEVVGCGLVLLHIESPAICSTIDGVQLGVNQPSAYVTFHLSHQFLWMDHRYFVQERQGRKPGIHPLINQERSRSAASNARLWRVPIPDTQPAFYAPPSLTLTLTPPSWAWRLLPFCSPPTTPQHKMPFGPPPWLPE
jgi:hypothetical protein